MEEDEISIKSRESVIEENTIFTVEIPDKMVTSVGNRIGELILQKVTDRFVEENYENIVNEMDIPEIAEVVGKLIKNKLATDILNKQLKYDTEGDNKQVLNG